MSECGCNTLLSTVIQSHHTTVAQRQLQFALALLAGHLAGYGTVHLVGEPILTSDSLQLQDTSHLLAQVILIILHVSVMALYGVVAHNGLGAVSEHLAYFQVEGTHAISLLESEVGIASGFAHHI